MSTSASPPVHASLQHLHRRIALGLAERHGLRGREALELAAVMVTVLQEELGGDRLGSKGYYIPAPDRRTSRDERIRDLMGLPPYSQKRVREVASREGVSIRTVWRAISMRAGERRPSSA